MAKNFLPVLIVSLRVYAKDFVLALVVLVPVLTVVLDVPVVLVASRGSPGFLDWLLV